MFQKEHGCYFTILQKAYFFILFAFQDGTRLLLYTITEGIICLLYMCSKETHGCYVTLLQKAYFF
jgi:uncharacterized protein YdaU (DUF1376 family)